MARATLSARSKERTTSSARLRARTISSARATEHYKGDIKVEHEVKDNFVVEGNP